MAAAVLPIALIAPVLRVVTDDTREVEAARLDATVRDTSAAISVQLEGISAPLVTLAGASGRRVLGGDDGLRDTLQRGLGGLVAGDSPVVAAGAVGLDGRVVLGAPKGEFAALPASLVRRVAGGEAGTVLLDEASLDESGHVTVLTPVRGRDGPLGVLAADVSLARLLSAAVGDAWPAGRTIALRDAAGGDPRYTADRPAGLLQLPGQVVGRAIDPGSGFEGSATAPLSAAGFAGWTVTVHEQLTVSSLPIAPLIALLAAALLLVALVIWMARRVLEPAIELDEARHRMGQLYAAEREAALQDHLTGLGNHRAFQEELARQFDQSRRYHVPFAVLLVDLDEFKQVNDTLGHAIGDDLLVEVGRLIRATIRQADRGFRTGGDEFAVVLPHTKADGAADLGRRLLTRMLEDRSAGTYRRPISYSGGVAAVPEHASDRTDLLARADAALYRSKRGGRTLITTFDAAVDRPSLSDHERSQLAEKLLKLIQDRALKAVYQPIVNIRTGLPIAFEGLIRPAPGRGFESTVALFTAAELTGRMIELDRACLDAVVAGATAVPEEVYVSLNISPRTFEAPEFSANAFAAVLARHAIAPGRVILELTEREPIHDIERLRAALDACRAMGVRIAADDVGAGNAGLRLLSQIKFDVVKIDLSLVQAGANGEPVESVLRSLVDLARRWGALVVAEGVETPQQLRIIRDLGIGAAQGYLLARPGPLDLRARFDVEQLVDLAGTWWTPQPAALGLERVS